VFYSQAEVDDMIRKSTNLLLTRSFSGCLSSLFRKPSVALLQVIQIIIDTGYLEEATVYLEEFVSNITGYVICQWSSTFSDSWTTKTFEVSTALKIQVEFLWAVTLCCVMVGYQRFRGPCCLQLYHRM